MLRQNHGKALPPEINSLADFLLPPQSELHSYMRQRRATQNDSGPGAKEQWGRQQLPGTPQGAEP